MSQDPIQTITNIALFTLTHNDDCYDLTLALTVNSAVGLKQDLTSFGALILDFSSVLQLSFVTPDFLQSDSFVTLTSL